MSSVSCVVCPGSVALPATVELSEIVVCRDCGQEHEVIETDPAVRLELAPEIEEDWGE
ncbi:hypothetical protein [Nocardia sp. NPDC050793]|uniref:hypothetical protein n=1 Tax=Nocardia sp. NPDC050793 TaxID=3155159 RepID=UPI0034056C98